MQIPLELVRPEAWLAVPEAVVPLLEQSVFDDGWTSEAWRWGGVDGEALVFRAQGGPRRVAPEELRAWSLETPNALFHASLPPLRTWLGRDALERLLAALRLARFGLTPEALGGGERVPALADVLDVIGRGDVPEEVAQALLSHDLEALGQHALAARLFKAIVRRAETTPGVFAPLSRLFAGRALERSGRPAEALALTGWAEVAGSSIRAASPVLAETLTQRAACHAALGDRHAALRCASRAWAIQPSEEISSLFRRIDAGALRSA